MGQEKNTNVKKNGQSMNPFCLFYYQDSIFTLSSFALNLLNYSVSGKTTSESSSTGHVGPCFSTAGASEYASMGPKVDVITSSATAARMVANVKSSQPFNSSATKTVTSSKTTAKVSSLIMDCDITLMICLLTY